MQPFIHNSLTRQAQISSCKLTTEDLKQLYSILNKKTAESINFEIEKIKKDSFFSAEQIKKIEDAYDRISRLYIEVNGANGEFLAGDDISIFNEEAFPNTIISVKFTSGKGFTNFTNQLPNNAFEIFIDFSTPPILDLSNPAYPTKTNQSFYRIFGINQTWVNGVFKTFIDFTQSKKTTRNYLYKKHTYDLILTFIFFPLLALTLYRFNTSLIIPAIFKNNSLFAVVSYIYLTLLLTFSFRILFNFIKFLCPKIEQSDSLSISQKNRKLIISFMVLIFVALAVDTIKNLISNLA